MSKAWAHAGFIQKICNIFTIFLPLSFDLDAGTTTNKLNRFCERTTDEHMACNATGRIAKPIDSLSILRKNILSGILPLVPKRKQFHFCLAGSLRAEKS